MNINIKKYLPQRLFSRGIVMIAAPILFLQFIVVYLILERYWDRVSEKYSENTSREIATLIAESNLARRGQIAKNLGFILSFTPAQPLPKSRSVSRINFLHRTFISELKKQISNPVRLNTTQKPGVVFVWIALDGGLLELIVPTGRVYALRTYQILIWVALSGILVMLIAILFLRNQVRPIQRLAVATKRFGRGLEVNNFIPTGASEVREAGQAFLVMRDNLRAHIAQRTSMLSAISHDLRTALTRIKLQATLLPDNKERKALEGDISQMEKMLLGYLDFARGERLTEKPTRVHLSVLLEELVAPYAQVKLTCPADLHITLSEQAIRRCLDNLLHNAITYGKIAALKVQHNYQGVEITIEDNGPGIPESDYEKAFRPFVRLDEARNQNITGTGLGLAIARDFVQGAGGTIQLYRASMGGLGARLFLPF